MSAKSLYIIHCIDDDECGMEEGSFGGVRFGGSKKRMSVYMEHKAWQGETSNPESPNYIKKIAAGPMESEDGKFMVGSCFIVEATRAEATAFNENDPFFKAGVWKSITINKYISIPNGIKPVLCKNDGPDLTTIRMEVPE
jgi:uncharacterized protein